MSFSVSWLDNSRFLDFVFVSFQRPNLNPFFHVHGCSLTESSGFLSLSFFFFPCLIVCFRYMRRFWFFFFSFPFFSFFPFLCGGIALLSSVSFDGLVEMEKREKKRESEGEIIDLRDLGYLVMDNNVLSNEMKPKSKVRQA